MNFSLLSPNETFQQAWQLLGWTMILFLAAGTVVFIIGSALRVILKRANPSVRYATSLATFAVLAITPIIMAGYLSASLPRQWGELTNPTRERAELTTNNSNSTKELLNAVVAKSAEVKTYRENPLVSRKAERVVDERVPASNIYIVAILNLSTAYLPWLWIVGTPLTFLLLATGLIGAERLRNSCHLLNDGPIRSACDELQKTLRIGRQVGVAVCERITTPLLVGVVKPLILLPPAALNGWTTAELEMVLVHELAHVRRWDNAVNLAQRIAESLLFFHPAVWIVSSWVRHDREDCCDATVVGHTAKPQAYAELLLALASHTPGLAASAAMAQHPVAGRIRRILKIEDEPMLVTRKGMLFGVSAVVVAALLAVALPTTDAEETVNQNSKFSREAERVADERAGATNPPRQQGEKETTNKNLTTEATESTEEKPKTAGDSVQYLVVYPLDKNEADIKSWLKAIDLAGEIHLVTKDGKDMAVVTATRKQHEKVSALLQSKRGEKETTNNTNGTKEEASRQRQRPEVNAEGTEQTPPFPSLEEQRAADLAYKLLGVELEKLTSAELRRVKAKGYKGGLRVASREGGPFQWGDLLVGLHVWPTESLQQVTEILQRDDLDQLSPLKFYVLTGGPVVDGYVTDAVSTGRIQIDLDAWREMREPALKQLVALEKQIQEELAEKENLREADTAEDRARLDAEGRAKLDGERAMLDAEITQLREILEQLGRKIATRTPREEVTTVNDNALLYDGKTFDEWRSLWKTELKTEKRIECIKALAAFGRAGKGAEAAEAILDVAGQYDFAMDGPSYIEDNAVGKLKESILEVLTNYGNHLPVSDWLPVLQLRLNKDAPSYRGFATQVLPRLVTSDKSAKPILLALQQNEDQAVRQAALSAIHSSQDIYTDDEKNRLIQAVLAEEPVTAIRVLDQRLLDNVSVEQAVEFLLSEDIEVQLATRQALRLSNDLQKVPQLAQLVEQVLNDSNRQQDRLQAVRALAALRYHAAAAEPTLTKLIESTDDKELMLAAVYAREMATLERNQSRSEISKETKEAVKKSGRWQKYLEDESLLENAFNSETTRVFGSQWPMGGMGGGGMGGGGMF